MPRSKESNQKIKDDRKKQILNAALNVFSTKGLSAAKITDIAEKAGISQGLIYHYYRSKEEIFTGLIRNAIDRMNQAALQLEQYHGDPETKIEAAVTELFKGIAMHKETAMYYLLFIQAAISDSVPAEAKDLLKAKNMVQHGVMSRIFREGQKQGTVKNFNCDEMSLLFWSVINGLALIKAVRGKDFVLPSQKIFESMFIK